jgi:hypothetical protein
MMDRQVTMFAFVGVLLFKVFIYSPLLVTGYAIVRNFMPKSAPGYFWVGAIIGLAVAIYIQLVVLKGWLIALRWKGNPAWIAIFGFCFLYTSAVPAIISFDLLRNWMPDYTVFSICISMGVGYFAYTRYHFLTDLVPSKFWLFYSAGLRMGGWRPKRNE